jgi:hypothetical protein
MTTLGMDTHDVVKGLLAAAFTEDQAETVTRLVSRARDVGISNLATKADQAEAKAEILKWIVCTIGVQTVIIPGAVVTILRCCRKNSAGGAPAPWQRGELPP